ncbi:hypothetical protein R1flu_028955 [Riccia fluitans]|uniref:Uncharacterized protein n=1 Tax=Riccia fluitans TaxID=41844 RepID=A0ABD1XN63_9MARC
MALSSQNSVSPSLRLSEDSSERTYSLYPDSSVNAGGGEFLEHQGSRQHDSGSDIEIDVDTADNRREEGNQSTNVREIREESNYGDDDKGGSGLETESVDYADGEFENMRESVRDGSVSPSYSSLRVEPDLEDSHSHLRLEEIFEGDGSATESEMDLANLSEPFAVSELELIERALQSLQNNHKSVRSEFSASANGEVEDIAVDERGPPSPDYRADANGVSRLLIKIQAVRDQKRDALVTRRRDNNRSPRPRSISTTGDQDVDFGDMRQLIQAASSAAFSAAKSAEIMVRSMDRNSQAIEELCKTLVGSTSSGGNSLTQKECAGGVEDNNEDATRDLIKLQDSELDIELRQAELTKKLQRQHTITHWVLGFMIISSFAWRFGVVKFVKRVNSAVSNPFQGITDYIDYVRGNGGDDKREAKQEKKLTLPSILPPGDSDGDKDGELPFNLGKILPNTGTETEVHSEQRKRR